MSREDQDAFAARSHARAHAAGSGVLAEEIEPIRIPQRRGDDLVVSVDEGVRPETDAAALARLRPAFSESGTITAGSASQISDGAAAVVVVAVRRGRAPRADRTRRDRRARSGGRAGLFAAAATSGGDRTGGEEAGCQLSDLDLIEINEAFAAVGVASARALGLTEAEIDERVNVHGGAIALGHPIGASGARLVLHLAMELHRRGRGLGVAALCGGGGQGDALVLSAAAAHRFPPG